MERIVCCIGTTTKRIRQVKVNISTHVYYKLNCTEKRCNKQFISGKVAIWQIDLAIQFGNSRMYKWIR
jgi:hypothetical protein